MSEPASTQPHLRKPFSYRLSLFGIAGLLLALPWWLYRDGFSLIAAIPGGVVAPLLLLFAVWNRVRNWSGITALCMIPLTVIGVMDVVANFTAPLAGLVIAVLSVSVFFAVLDAGRRE